MLWAVALSAVACGPQQDAADAPPPPPAATAQPTDAEAVAAAHHEYLGANYEKSEYMVAMRDGIELYTLVSEPRDRSREDPILPYDHGLALHAAISNSTLLTMEGVGHELPQGVWDTVIPAILDHTT